MGGERPVPAALGQEEQLEERVGVEPEPAAGQAQHPHPVLQNVQVHGGRAAPGTAAAAAIRADTGPPRNRPASPRDWPRTAPHCPGTASHRLGTALGPPRIAPGPPGITPEQLRNRPASLRQRLVTALIAPGLIRERPASRWDRPVTACLAPAPIRTAPGQPRHRRHRKKSNDSGPALREQPQSKAPGCPHWRPGRAAPEPRNQPRYRAPWCPNQPKFSALEQLQLRVPAYPKLQPWGCSNQAQFNSPGCPTKGDPLGATANPTLPPTPAPNRAPHAQPQHQAWRGDSPNQGHPWEKGVSGERNGGLGRIPACRKERDGLGTILGWEAELWGVRGLI